MVFVIHFSAAEMRVRDADPAQRVQLEKDMELDAVLIVENGSSTLATRHLIQEGVAVIIVSDAQAAYTRMHHNSFQAILVTPVADVSPLEFVLNTREIHRPVPILVPAVRIEERERDPLRGMGDVYIVEGTHSEFGRNAVAVLAGHI